MRDRDLVTRLSARTPCPTQTRAPSILSTRVLSQPHPRLGYRVTVEATVVNNDAEDHGVNVCVDNCLVYLPDDPNDVYHTADLVPAHKSFTFIGPR
jgi:hypothetical protein